MSATLTWKLRLPRANFRRSLAFPNPLSKAMNDLKVAFRQLLKHPGFTAVAVLTLALGIGAATAIFSIFYGMLLKPLPHEPPGQLVTIREKADGRYRRERRLQ